MMFAFFPKLDIASQKIVFTTLLLLSFFGITFFQMFQGYHYIVAYGLISFLYFAKENVFPYKKIIYWYLFFLLLSCVYSQIYNGQFLFKTIGFSGSYLGILFTFFLLHQKLSSKQLLDCLLFLSLLYCIGYIVQWVVYPFPIFEVANNEGKNLDYYRIRIPGSLCAYVLYFYGLNRYLQYKKMKYIAYSILSFIPIVIMGFRTLTVLSLVFTVILIGFVKRNVLKSVGFLFVVGIMALGVSQLDIVQDKVLEMQDRQESDQTFDNPDYIRWIEYSYFTETFFVKPGEQFFGGGVPAGTTSYAKAIETAEGNALYWVDLGMIGLTWIIGIPAVILLIVIYLWCAKRCKSPDIQFVRFTLLLLVIGSLVTTMELFRYGNILLVSFLLCYEYKYNQEMKLK